MSLSSTISVRAPSKRRGAQQPMPPTLAPMLAVMGAMPSSPADYSFEYKWDGVRALGFIENNRLRLLSRNQLDITHRYPELSALSDALAGQRVIVDGEIVALDDAGRPSFAQLQRRMHVADPARIRRLSKTVPIWYVLFDILYFDGRGTLSLPYTMRREMLENATLAGPFWQITPAHVGHGREMLEAARQNRLEGLIAKRLNSIYEPGRRSASWLKLKIVQRQEFVIGGWIDQQGDPSRVGSLLIGYYDCNARQRDARLHFAGGIGTGFTDAEHARLMTLLRQHEVEQSPFAERIPRAATAHYVIPALVAEIEYRRWPPGGQVQQGAYIGLRSDKPARQVVKETM